MIKKSGVSPETTVSYDRIIAPANDSLFQRLFRRTNEGLKPRLAETLTRLSSGVYLAFPLKEPGVAGFVLAPLYHDTKHPKCFTTSHSTRGGLS